MTIMATPTITRERLRKRKQGLATQIKGMALIIAVLVVFIAFLMALTILERLVLG
ncbi:MAG: hypothetical protein LBR39_04255 [Coriobacteriales bacterium]|jgi:hypothetical protein|nr:hypothetical protein [Coriobacteriales bacterium]